MKPTPITLWAVRVAGLLALGWVYEACFDLRWLFHVYRVQAHVLHAPFQFSFQPYLALSIANLLVAVLAVCLLAFFPLRLLKALAPACPNARRLGPFSLAAGVGGGLMVVLFGIFNLFAVTLWTIFQKGTNGGWQVELLEYLALAAAGFVVSRQSLARRGEA